MLTAVFLFTLSASAVDHPVYPPEFKPEQVEELKKSVAAAMAMTPRELFEFVPEQSGIYYCGCPHCDGGTQEHAMVWAFGMGDTVKCRHCGMVFPNEEYPLNRETTLKAPSGALHTYRWHENAQGRQYFFDARAWYEQWEWTRDMAWKLANLYALTGEPACAERAAAIVGRYAQVFPDYAVRFDFPFQPVRFWPADQKWPYDPDIGPFRGAKFYWWGYGDIPKRLALSYDLIASDDAFERLAALLGPDIRERIERDLIRLGYEFVAANPDNHGNMSPGMYRDMVIAGRIIGDPSMVHEGVERTRALVEKQFFADGWWRECAPSYHWQTIGGLDGVVNAAAGHSDPPGYPETRLENVDLAEHIPMLARARRAGFEGVLPNGRCMPVNDTWHTSRRPALRESVPRLWPHMGHAILGAGEDEQQFQVHINWNASYGHTHMDTCAILLFAHGRELLSDIGYTHTRYRNWTINSASHNTVVVDQRSQPLGFGDASMTGNLLFFDDTDPHVRMIDVDGSPAYPNCAVYRRRLVQVHTAEGRDYVVDCFDVAGGATHDFFLHGSADEKGVLDASLALSTPVPTLVPDWGGTQPHTGEDCLDTSGEKHHAYVFLRNIMSATADAPFHVTWRYGDAGLKTFLFPQAGSTAFRFESPSIRNAGELDQNLDKHLMEGILLRHPGSTSRFLAVHVPFRGEPWVTGVSAEGSRITVQRAHAQDTIVLDDAHATVTSSEGWGYDSGEAVQGRLEGISHEDGKAVLVCDGEVPAGQIVRLDFGNSRSMCLRVERVEGNHIVLAEDPGFEFDESTHKTTLRNHPHETLPGPVTWTVWRR